MAETRIAWLAPDGTGRAVVPGGGQVRLPGALPGDLVRWREVARRGRTVTGEVEALLEPSPDRVVPPCPHDASCGGCDLSALATAARHRVLADGVAHALGWRGEVPVLPSPRAAGHRARIKLAIRDGQVGYRPARSHDLVPVDTCRVARPLLQGALPRLRATLAACPDPALEAVELRTDDARVVYAFQTSGRLRPATREALASLGDVAVDGRALAGDPVLHLSVAGLRLRAGPQVFFQVNPEANERLVGAVAERVLAASPARALDLYAGIGNLGLPLAARGVPVIAVERDGPAIADLRASALAHDLQGVEALALPAERFDPSRTFFDVAVLDPPRAGAGEVLGRVLRNRPRRVVYVSCHLPAAARDLREHARGYTLTDVLAVDLFPETRHLEVVLVLDR